MKNKFPQTKYNKKNDLQTKPKNFSHLKNWISKINTKKSVGMTTINQKSFHYKEIPIKLSVRLDIKKHIFLVKCKNDLWQK